jgi:uncharacterized protein involved in exopolysaccharide biosynthesis
VYPDLVSNRSVGQSEQLPLGSLTIRQCVKLGAFALALIIFAAAGGLGVSLLLPPEYLARTQLIFQITTEEPSEFLREDRTLTTQVLLIEGRSVLGPVSDAYGLDVEDLTERVDATILENSKIINIEVVDRSPETATMLVAAISARYVELLQPLDNTQVRTYLESQLAEVRERQRTASADQLVIFAERESELLNQLDQLRVNTLAAPSARTVVAPFALNDPVYPRPKIVTLTSGLCALFVAAAVVALVARRWTRRARCTRR